MRRIPEFTALERAKSMMRDFRRNRPPVWRACRKLQKPASAPARENEGKGVA